MWRFDRRAFIAERFNYRPGEHVTIVAPTQSGKTTFGFELLDATSTPDLPAVVMVMKPRDPVVGRWGKRLDYPIARSWPPLRARLPGPLAVDKPRGYLVWPRHTFNVDTDDRQLADVFRETIRDSYKRGNRILVADEVWGLARELRLERPLIGVWSRGSSMGTGLWAFTQRPSHVPTWAWNQPNHLFIGWDPDKRVRDRFREIGGVDPEQIAYEAARLGSYEWLYIHRPSRGMCIVEAQ